MKLKMLAPSFFILLICFILSANSNFVNAKENDNSETVDLVVIGTIDDIEILIDRGMEIFKDITKGELIALTKEVLSRSGLLETEMSTFSVMLPKNVLVEHTCSPMAPYPLDSFYGRVYLKDGDIEVGYIDYFRCGNKTQYCEYVAAITTYY